MDGKHTFTDSELLEIANDLLVVDPKASIAASLLVLARNTGELEPDEEG